MGVAGQRLLTICLLVTDWWISRSYVVSFLGVPSTVPTQMSVDWVWTTLQHFGQWVGELESETAFSPELCFEFPIYTVALKGTPRKQGLEEIWTDSLGILGSCQEIMPMTFRILIWKVMSYAPRDDIGKSWKSTFPSPTLVTLSFDPSQINMRQTFGNIVFCRPRSV